MAYNIIVLFSGNGTNLQAIIDHNKSYNIVLAATDDPKARGIWRAQAAGILTYCSHQRKGQTREEYCSDLADTLEVGKPNLVVLAGFMKILPPEFCNRFAGRCINIHPSLLPNYKGLNTHERVLEAGEIEHGISIHWVTEELDAGDLIVQKSFIVTPEDTAEPLEQRTHALEYAWYPWVINQMAKGLDPTSIL